MTTWVRRALTAAAYSGLLVAASARAAAAAPAASAAETATTSPAASSPAASPDTTEPTDTGSPTRTPTDTATPTQTPTDTPTGLPPTDEPTSGTPSAPQGTEITGSVAMPAGGGQVGGAADPPSGSGDGSGQGHGAGAGRGPRGELANTGVAVALPAGFAVILLLAGTAAVFAGRRRYRTAPAGTATTRSATQVPNPQKWYGYRRTGHW